MTTPTASVLAGGCKQWAEQCSCSTSHPVSQSAASFAWSESLVPQSILLWKPSLCDVTEGTDTSYSEVAKGVLCPLRLPCF